MSPCTTTWGDSTSSSDHTTSDPSSDIPVIVEESKRKTSRLVFTPRISSMLPKPIPIRVSLMLTKPMSKKSLQRPPRQVRGACSRKYDRPRKFRGRRLF